MALDYVKSDVENKIPIEILIHCWINYIPSPINDSLRLNNFSPTIFISCIYRNINIFNNLFLPSSHSI